MVDYENYSLINELRATDASDSDGIARVWEHTQPVLLGFLKSRHPSGVDFDDVLQRTLIKMWQKWPLLQTLPDDRALRNYLLSTMFNNVKDDFRRQNLRQQTSLDLVEFMTNSEAQDPADQVVRKVSSEQAMGMLNMNDVMIQALVAIEVDGNSYEQFANKEGIPVGTVKSRVNRAKEKVRKRWRRF